MSDGIVIVGGGLAAQRCCETLRATGLRRADPDPLRRAASSLRPAAALEGGADRRMPPAAVGVPAAGWYEERGVDLLLGDARHAPRRRRARGSSSRAAARCAYEHLLIATGAAPRAPARARGLRQRHTSPHARRRRARCARALRPGRRLAVVGAGFIGLEAASSARPLGAEVTIVEAPEAPLARRARRRLGRWFADLHRAEGVACCSTRVSTQVRGGRRVASSSSCRRRPRGMRSRARGSRRRAGHALAQRAAASAPAGVPVDPEGRTRAAGVYAAGDAALAYDPALGRHRAQRALGGGRAPGRRGRAGDARPRAGPPPLPRASGATSTASASSTSATRTRSRPRSRRRRSRQPGLRSRVHRGGVPVAALLVGRPRALPDARRRVQAGLESIDDHKEKQHEASCADRRERMQRPRRLRRWSRRTCSRRRHRAWWSATGRVDVLIKAAEACPAGGDFT